MVFQYVHDPRATEVERKLNSIRESNDIRYIQNQINSVLSTPSTEVINDSIQPEKHFIDEYKKRQILEKNREQKEEFLSTVDDQGHKLEKIYNNTHFQSFHDTHRVYSGKKNYESLAWKVFTQVPENNSFLKVLYYPNIRSSDYSLLVGYFTEEHRKRNRLFNLNLILSLGVAGFGFYSAKNFNFKTKSTLLFSAFVFGAVYYGLNNQSLKRMNSRLNSKALEVAKNYSDIKLLNIHYGKVNI